MNAAKDPEGVGPRWTNVAPPTAFEVAAIRAEPREIEHYLRRAFSTAFEKDFERIEIEAFPGTLQTCIVAEGADELANAWAALITGALADAGLRINVYVRDADEFEDEPSDAPRRTAGRFKRPAKKAARRVGR